MTIGPDGKHRLSRVLYRSEFSHNSEGARGYAISSAGEFSSQMTPLHVAENASDLAEADAITARRTQELDKLVSETERKNLNVKTVVRIGKAYVEIVAMQKKDAPASLS
jgi:hypothetical protein